MDFHIFKKEKQITNPWSGGTSTQLLIYPFESTLADRNFILRISSATVETETSVFSDFTGFNRILMILKGQLQLHHETNEMVLLNSFDQYQFNGGRKTHAHGKVTDFNVIWNSALKNVSLSTLNAASTITPVKNGIVAGYCLKGKATVNEKEINEEDLFFAEEIKEGEFVNINTGNNSVLLLLTAELAL